MNSLSKLKILSKSAEETEKIGFHLGKQLEGGEVIELIGDIGAGKTTFVRGLAKGLGSEDKVTSPTFMVCQIYQGRMPLYHYDFYRLEDFKIIENDLAETTKEAKSVIVLEWAEDVRRVLPKNHIVLQFTAAKEDTRSIELHIPQEYIRLEEKFL